MSMFMASREPVGVADALLPNVFGVSSDSARSRTHAGQVRLCKTHTNLEWHVFAVISRQTTCVRL